jgi:hypothetical protein
VKWATVLVEEGEVGGFIARSKSVSHRRSLTTNVHTQSQVEMELVFSPGAEVNDLRVAGLRLAVVGQVGGGRSRTVLGATDAGMNAQCD